MGRLIIMIFCLFTYVHISAQEVLRIPMNHKKINDTIMTFTTTLYDDYFLLEKVTSLDNYYVNNQNKLIPKFHSDFPSSKWTFLNLYGFKDEDIMPELMKKQNAEVGIIYNRNKLLISIDFIAIVYNFNPLSSMYSSVIQNQFGIKGWLSYDFNENVSVSIYGKYVTNSFYHSMASLPYVTTSSFGGFITLHTERYGVDLGVNNYYDAFNRCWQTNPIVRPTYKVGKVKIGMDVGPLIKEGILCLMNKQRVNGPIIMPFIQTSK